VRTGNQFKAEHVGAQLALFACHPGCVSRGGAHGVGLEVGGKIRQCSLGAGSTALQAAWKRMGAGRATSAPE